MKREFQISFLRRFDLRPEAYLVDLGCGTLRGGIPLIRFLNKSHYYGIDVRADVLREAEREVDKEGVRVKAPVLIHAPDLSALPRYLN